MGFYSFLLIENMANLDNNSSIHNYQLFTYMALSSELPLISYGTNLGTIVLCDKIIYMIDSIQLG